MTWHTSSSGRRFSRGNAVRLNAPSSPVDPRVLLPKKDRPHIDTVLADGSTLTTWTDQPIAGVSAAAPVAPMLSPTIPPRAPRSKVDEEEPRVQLPTLSADPRDLP